MKLYDVWDVLLNTQKKKLRGRIVETRLAKFRQLMRLSNGNIGIIATFGYI